jgi:hypothetical protein
MRFTRRDMLLDSVFCTNWIKSILLIKRKKSVKKIDYLQLKNPGVKPKRSTSTVVLHNTISKTSPSTIVVGNMNWERERFFNTDICQANYVERNASLPYTILKAVLAICQNPRF